MDVEPVEASRPAEPVEAPPAESQSSPPPPREEPQPAPVPADSGQNVDLFA
jgi:hypothetical protein